MFAAVGGIRIFVALGIFPITDLVSSATCAGFGAGPLSLFRMVSSIGLMTPAAAGGGRSDGGGFDGAGATAAAADGAD